MKKALLLSSLLGLAACTGAPKGAGAETEDAIAKRAADIRADAEADVTRQIAEIDAAANAEAARLPDGNSTGR